MTCQHFHGRKVFTYDVQTNNSESALCCREREQKKKAGTDLGERKQT